MRPVRPTRRAFLGAGLAGTLGLALSPAFQRLLAQDGPARRAKRCILLWLNGGPSHIDTFDPKPGQDTGGPFKAIATAAPGIQLAEHLPKLAGQAKHLAFLRSLTSKEGDHDRAYTFLHTGNVRDETVEYPSLGAVVGKTWSAEDGDLPSFVALNGGSAGAGFFGVEFEPHTVTNMDAPLDNLNLPEGVDEERFQRRLKALEAFNAGAARRMAPARVAEQQRFLDKALKLRTSPQLKAFDLGEEKAELKAAYGVKEGEGAEAGTFGKACLLARRLIEHGVRFVEVTLDGWDTHDNNFAQVEALCKQLDPAVSTLVGDLHDRGLLQDTLVICMGEFGRTPVINPANGRDHHSEVFSAVLAGGGVKGGQVVGASDDKGAAVKDRPVTVPDLYATLLAACGVDPARQYRSPGGRPIKLADKGKVVRELFR